MEHKNNEEIVQVASGEMNLLSNGIFSSSWIVDSGATQHMSHDSEIFENYQKLDRVVKIQIGDENTWQQ